MQKETTTKNPMFKREQRIGMSFLETRVLNESKYFKITGLELARLNKRGETNDFLLAVDLESGEEGMIYVDGGLKGKIMSFGGFEKLVNRSIELIWRGTVEATINGTDYDVNNYDMYLVSENN